MSNDTAVLDEVMEAPAEQTRASILAEPSRAAESELPAWFEESQASAWTEFQKLPMPARKDQAWRFSSVDLLDLAPFAQNFSLGENEARSIVARSTGLAQTSGRLIFADDHLVQLDPLPEEYRRRGVIFLPLARALREHGDLVRRHFMTQPASLGSQKFAALHQALVRNGTFLYVPRGVEISAPLETFHWSHEDNAALFPHTLIVAEEMSKVTLVEYFRSTNPQRAAFACGVNDLVAGPGARLTYVAAQEWGERVLSLQMNATTVARDASAISLNLHLGGRYSRLESLSRLVGEGSRSDLLAVSVADGAQEFDARTLQDHASPHTNSDLLYKNALSGRSRITFGGLIRVEPHAHFTDAYQKVRNLLLSDDAEANSMPGLEILADNVKCSHGATSGQLDDEEMFYLLARGIPAGVARQLLVGGFLNEAIERFPEPAVVALLEAMIAAKFARMNRKEA